MPSIEEVAEVPAADVHATNETDEGIHASATRKIQQEDLKEQKEEEKLAGEASDSARQELAIMTEEEKMALCKSIEASRRLKAEGNELFGQHNYEGAASKYSEAIDLAPEGHMERSVFLNNRATCYFKLGNYEQVINDCTAALKIDPDYAKCLLRRAQAYEIEKKVCEAYDDFQRVVKLDGSNSIALSACKRLEKPAAEEREKQKEEMMGKLKDLGNSILGKFGMSLDSFKAVQDPNTGSYSISYNPGA